MTPTGLHPSIKFQFRIFAKPKTHLFDDIRQNRKARGRANTSTRKIILLMEMSINARFALQISNEMKW